jgi:hypothetical protein
MVEVGVGEARMRVARVLKTLRESKKKRDRRGSEPVVSLLLKSVPRMILVGRSHDLRACSAILTRGDHVLGIEELFLNITQQLVERKVAIENARVLRSRDSIMLTEADVPAISASSWCCL